jgi:lysophospholipase L1-like esterase
MKPLLRHRWTTGRARGRGNWHLERRDTGTVEDPSIRASLVDVFSLFVGRAFDLTLLGEQRPGFHSNDTGYRRIAKDLIRAYREQGSTGRIASTQ